MQISKLVALSLTLALALNPVRAGEGDFGGLKFEGLYFISYESFTTTTGMSGSDFVVSRGYNTLKKTLTDQLSSRLTIDLTTDATGNLIARSKYAYVAGRFGDWGFLTAPGFEFGQIHTPYIDFLEPIYGHRMQGSVFIERVGVAGSADFGLMFTSLLGGKLDVDLAKSIGDANPGRWGSAAVGVFNGGGYNAKEANLNKVIEARVSARPLADVVPGLQISYFGAFGKGNVADTIQGRDWNSNLIALTYADTHIRAGFENLMGSGNSRGNWADSINYSGISAFAHGNIIGQWGALLRFDSFDPNGDVTDDEYTIIIAGVSYQPGAGNTILADYELKSTKVSGEEDAAAVKVTWQVKF